ncbi:MAG: AAA family ATPase [Candidatus Kapaibacterium sp.]
METLFTINKSVQAGDFDYAEMLLLAPLMKKMRKMVMPYFWTFESIIKNEIDTNDIREALTKIGYTTTFNGNWTYMLTKNCLVTLVAGRINETTQFCKYTFSIFATSRPHLYAMRDTLRNIVTNVQPELICETRWYYGAGSYDYESIFETMEDTVVPQAYPFIANLESTIQEYARSNESILLLIGEPGTGKSRLIRYIIRQMAKVQQTQHIKVYYTSNATLLNGDSIYSDFRTSDASAFILEDADLHLSSRADGNDVMTKLLSSSDSFISASTNKKIILTTNLASLNGTDDALLRPGRCFGVIETRKFTRNEAQRFFEAIAPGRNIVLENELYTLAELYRLLSPHAESVRQLSDSARYKLASKRSMGFAAV